MTLHLADSLRWQAPTLGPGAPREAVAACYRAVLAAVQSRWQAAGLAKALPLIAAAANGRDHPALDGTDPLIRRASEPISAIAAACRRRDIDGIAAHSRALIGLGPGLTPSGDDYVGGLLFAAHSLRAAYPGAYRLDGNAIDALIDWTRSRTTLISAAIFRDMVGGQGPEPLHQLLIALLNSAEPHRVLTAVDRLTRIGHSSGWDMLAGVLTGLLLIER
ncbi:MAG TPA: DUF2877 domain-containing protein [Aggregatilineaceae bacterium]|nr:DUF2877 domain-containing protein [Aggregatilineaceae bacterium]